VFWHLGIYYMEYSGGIPLMYLEVSEFEKFLCFQ